jgi:proteasome lid subunit RPN8/RPN11
MKIAESAIPNEAVALLFGTIKSHSNQLIYEVKLVEEFQSSIPSPVSFILEDIEQLYKKWNSAQQQGFHLIAIFHSHPSSAYPSEIDKINMINLSKIYKKIIWIIYGNYSKKLNAFVLENETIYQIKIEQN